MTSYAAYDAGLPCKNANCKSHGRPHPNCRCYGDMADGGDVRPFCSQSRSHESGCEYFSDGGDVAYIDPHHAVAGHFANGGLVGVLKMHEKPDLDHYDKSVAKGHKNLDDTIGKIFNNERLSKLEDRSKQHAHIEKWLDSGGAANDIHQANYADGGQVEKHHSPLHGHPIEQAYPDQNIVLNAAKGRVSGYLHSLKPQANAPKLAFDREPDQKQQKKIYKDALTIADHPLSILHEVDKGTVSPDHVKHLNAMYPEMGEALQKKITEKIIRAQMDGKRPSHKIRQGLSLLMGTPLSSEFTHQNIQAAQAVFAAKKPESQPQPGASHPKSNLSKLSKSEQAYQTGNQSLVRRSQKI